MAIETARAILAQHGARFIEVALADNPDGPVQEITSRHACGVDYEVVIGDASEGDRGQAWTVWSKSVTFGATDRTVAGGHDFVMAARESNAVAQACLALIDHGVHLNECADCGGSTAAGTPDPHVCGEIGGAA